MSALVTRFCQTAGIIDSIIAVGQESSKQVCNKQIGNKFDYGQQQGE